MASLTPNAKQQFFDNAGNPAAGYKLYTYAANTLSLQATYTDAAGAAPNSNPIILDARGEAVLYLTSGVMYDYVLKTAADVTVWTREDVSTLAGSADSVTFTQAGTGAVARTSQDKMRDAVSVDDFGAVGTGTANDTPALALALASGAKRITLTPGKSYRLDGQIVVSSPVELVAYGATVTLGTGQVAGDSSVLVNTSGFSVSGGNFVAAVRTTAFKIEPGATIIEDFDFDGCNFTGFFYDVYAEGNAGASRPVRNVTIRGCTGIGPVGINSGRFLSIYCDGVTYSNNNIDGAYNSSAYGCQNCTNVTITGNRERGVVDTGPNVEAAIQVEGGLGPVVGDHHVTITGNVCAHDIWVSDASNVTTDGNTCRVLRVTVGNPGTTGAYRNSYSDNNAACIVVQPYGTPGANKIAATFKGNILAPNGISILGVPITTAIFIDGAVCNLIKLTNNEVVNSATTYSIAVARASGLRLYSWDNELGTLAHSITGSGGVIYEKNNRNPLFPAECGYIAATPTADITMGLGSWAGVALGTEQVDANAEFTAASGSFTPLETGTYRFSGGFLCNLLAVGDDVGFRLYRTSGTPAELRRVGYAQPGGTGFSYVPLAPTDLRLTAGDVVQLQYFHSAAGAGSILSGATLSQLQIKRMS